MRITSETLMIAVSMVGQHEIKSNGFVWVFFFVVHTIKSN